MTAGSTETNDSRRRRRVLVAAALFCVGLAAAAYVLARGDAPGTGPTIGEKLSALRGERAALQARAGGQARLELLPSFRAASLLSDALAARYDDDRERSFERLPAVRRQAFIELDALNAALRDAVERPGAGSLLVVAEIAKRLDAEVERMAAVDDSPVILSTTPSFVPPRRATGELTLTPGPSVPPPAGGTLRLDRRRGWSEGTTSPTVPRYVPTFAAPGEEDPPVEVEIVGLRLAVGGGLPVLTVGAWRGEATVMPERLRFSVPRSAFPTDAARTSFASGSLALRHASRTTTFQILFTVLPDKPGSFALDQRVRTTVPESNTLVSPELLARAPAGETRTVRRCFDPSPGWRFDKDKRRVVIVERLGWLDDIPDETMNGGSVEFVPEETPGQICIAVVAKPVTKAARTATIGRFEATLVRDRPVERAMQSGVRALDWNEPARVPLEPGMVEWRLYLRLFEEIDREFEGKAGGDAAPAGLPFLSITIDADGKNLVLRADPAAAP